MKLQTRPSPLGLGWENSILPSILPVGHHVALTPETREALVRQTQVNKARLQVVLCRRVGTQSVSLHHLTKQGIFP